MRSRQFSVTVDEAVYDRVAAMAAAERRSVSGMAAVLLFAGLRDPVLGERYVPEPLSAEQRAATEAARTRDREWQLEASRNTALAALGETDGGGVAVRGSVDVDGLAVLPTSRGRTAVVKKPRTKPCVHRISPEAFCKLCD